MVWILFACLLVLLIFLWPKGLWLILGAAAIVSGIAVYWNSVEKRTLDSVALTAHYAPEECPAKRPMLVSFINQSDKTVERILFRLEADVPGYSSVVTPYTYRQNASEKILAPGETYTACFPIPELSQKALEELGSLAPVPPEDTSGTPVGDNRVDDGRRGSYPPSFFLLEWKALPEKVLLK